MKSMVASKNTYADVVDNLSSPALGCSSSVPCSICFDLVIDDGERSTAKLHCGHKFHLDCIGSAFNSKGTMQCPNCRKVESGRWLFADGSAHAVFETGAQARVPNEGPHDLSYSRMPFGFQWCPFSGFTVHSSIEEAEPSLDTFTNFQGNHAMITEHTTPPSLAHSYISFFQPNEHVGNSNFHRPLNAISAPRNDLHAANFQHPSWGWNCHYLPYNADRDYIDHGDLAPVHPATMRSARAPADAVARSFSLLHPSHYTQQPVSRSGGSSVASSQSRERIQILHTSYHLEQPSDTSNMLSSTNGFRRFSGARSLPMVLPAVRIRHDHRGSHGFYVREAESSYNYAHERDHSSHFPVIRESFHHH
ncbi:E3 ubiquitin-protein ligase RFI2 [Cynara cardunculus var. scolymus]|uniref:E3 ubiquitin-protein ligase RFI2 n=1 Tax=Cynara cardunculus var. scolymus TaxID=59895 RepID=UPI000D6239EC|nr:E3 ubiquitin-protein ligase RFI2 [Cynara cardunculus var. scolymus]